MEVEEPQLINVEETMDLAQRALNLLYVKQKPQCIYKLVMSCCLFSTNFRMEMRGFRNILTVIHTKCSKLGR